LPRNTPIYNYLAKIIVTIDDHKILKYIKSDIIVDYIYIAKKYNPNIFISREIQFKNKCYCNIWYKNLPIDETGKHVCSCGFEADEIKSDISFDKTISRKAKNNFRKAFNLLQGNIKPPQYDSIVKKIKQFGTSILVFYYQSCQILPSLTFIPFANLRTK